VGEGPSAKPKWTTRRKLLVAFGVLIGSAMVVIPSGLFWELHEANTAFRGFTGALIAKQYERAYDFTSPALRATADYATFVNVHDGLTLRMGNLESVEINKSEVNERKDGWYATLDACLVFDHGSLPFVLKKAGRSWEIYNYREQ
jgi:hypothetical protein